MSMATIPDVMHANSEYLLCWWHAQDRL